MPVTIWKPVMSDGEVAMHGNPLFDREGGYVRVEDYDALAALAWDAHNMLQRWRDAVEHFDLSEDEWVSLVQGSDELQDELLDAELANGEE